MTIRIPEFLHRAFLKSPVRTFTATSTELSGARIQQDARLAKVYDQVALAGRATRRIGGHSIGIIASDLRKEVLKIIFTFERKAARMMHGTV
jgi:hypothetical protein